MSRWKKRVRRRFQSHSPFAVWDTSSSQYRVNPLDVWDTSLNWYRRTIPLDVLEMILAFKHNQLDRNQRRILFDKLIMHGLGDEAYAADVRNSL